MDVQFGSPRLEVNIAERLQSAGLQGGEFDKYTAISGETLKVDVALPIQAGAHLLDLKISHITYTPAQSAFVWVWAAELKALNQAALRQHLSGYAHNLTEAYIAGKYTDNVCAAGNPDERLIFVGL